MNFDSSISSGFGGSQLSTGQQSSHLEDKMGHEMYSDCVNLDRENRLYLEMFQTETSKT